MRRSFESDLVTYDRLRDLLTESSTTATVTALPDGSVDRYCDVRVGVGRNVESVESLGRSIADGEVGSFRIDEHDRRPGGQAVNLARASHALGDDVAVYGHLDDPLFDELSFETVSMGGPAEILVLTFGGEALFVADESADIRRWSFEDFEQAAADVDEALTADAVACTDWVSFPGMSDALHAVAERDPDGNWFVVDPGDVAGSDPDDLDPLFDALAALSHAYDVVVSVNESEATTLAEAANSDGDERDASDGDRDTSDDGETDVAAHLRAVRSASEAAAVVMHGTERAVAVTADESRAVAAPRVEDPSHPTGGGDTFGGGLVHALVRNWGWDDALALGNACSSYLVEHGEPADRETLIAYLADAEIPDIDG